MVSVRLVEKIYNSLRKLGHLAGYNVDIRKISKSGFPAHVPEDFILKLSRIRDLTLVPWEGMYMSYQAAAYAAQGIEGDIVECGVWRGGVSMLMAETAHTLDARAGRKRKFYLYDTFAGFPKPGLHDKSPLGSMVDEHDDTSGSWCLATLEEVRKNIGATSLPQDSFVLVKGKVEDTIPKTMPDKIALLRLDTDFYESTLHELRHLYPRLVPGGVLICDDYSDWDGARKAVDEYFAKEAPKPFLYIDPHCGRVMAIKRQG